MQPAYRHYFAHDIIEQLGQILENHGLIDRLIAVEAPVYLNQVPALRWALTPAFFFYRLLTAQGKGVLLVRDFNNLQMLLAWPLLWPFRKRLYWVNNHNLQSALRKPFVAWLLRCALSTGFNLVLIESPEGIKGHAHRDYHSLILPYPVQNGRMPVTKAGKLRVGFVGRFRADKAQEEALQFLLTNPLPNCEIVVANPDASVRKKYAALGCTTLDTTTGEQFRAALENIDVAVVNYCRDAYEFRPSGIVRDLIEAGVAVTCPDFPVLADQISTPAPVGSVYTGLAQLPQALENAHAMRLESSNFARYFHYRTPENIVALFKQQIEHDHQCHR
jgi:hypothetical protein